MTWVGVVQIDRWVLLVRGLVEVISLCRTKVGVSKGRMGPAIGGLDIQTEESHLEIVGVEGGRKWQKRC